MSERTIWIGLGLAFMAATSCGGEAAASAGALEAPSPRALHDLVSDETRALRALEEARKKKALLSGAPDFRKASLRRRAVRAYLDVARRYPGSGEVAAEASFRAAELLRRGGEEERALEEFKRAADTARGGSFVPRALYEAGHIERRRAHFDAALALFEHSERCWAADAHRRDLAALWQAKTRLEMGDQREAERLLRGLVTRAVDPVDRLRSYDELIMILARSGRVAAAVGHLAAAKRSVASASREATQYGERVRRTLENMRALDVLRQAIADARE